MPRVLALSLLVLSACPPPATEELQLTPSTLELSVGEARQVTARILVGATSGEATGATWISSDRNIVTVSSSGDGTATFQAAGEGVATVTARLRDLTATVQVTVTPLVVRLNRIEVTPSTAMVPRGLSLQLTATGIFTDGSRADLTSSVAWSSSEPTRASVNASGLVSGLETGTSELSAAQDGITGRLTVTVTSASVQNIVVTPVVTTLARGTRAVLTATATLSDTTTQDVTAQATWTSSEPTVASVDASGQVTALDVGTSTISAALQNVSGMMGVTVTDAVLTALSVTPPSSTLPRGTSVDLTATGTFSDTTTQDLSTQVTWSSNAPAVAAVTSSGAVTALSLGTATITATSSSGSLMATADITVTAATLQMIQVNPPNAMLALGLTRTFTATGIFSDTSTQDLTSQVVWSSSAPTTASVSNAMGTAGLVTALAVGPTTITATRGTVSGSTPLTVTSATVVSLSVTPVAPSLAKGLTQQFTARGTFSDMSMQDVTTQVTWSTGTPSVASVSNANGSEGMLTALGVGSSTVIATINGVMGQTNVNVTAAVMTRIDLTPMSVTLAKGRTQQLTATGVFTDSTTQDLTSQAMWSSATPFVATVSPSGVLTAVNPGNATITASFMSLMGIRPVSVTAAAIDSIDLTPSSFSVPKGLVQVLTARANFSDSTNQDVTTQVTWLSSAPLLLAVSNASGTQGNATALGEGMGTVSATLMGVTGNASFNVLPPSLTGITVTPMVLSLPKGRSQQYVATGTYSDASMQNVTLVATWSSTTPAAATVSSAGVALAVNVGSTNLEASIGAVSASVPLDVIPPVLDHIDVTPLNPSRAKGLTQQFAATGVLTDGTQQNLTASALWASSNMTAVGVNGTGLGTALAVGSSDVTATLGGITGTSTFTVTPAQVVSVTVSPANPSIAKGRNQAFTALATLTDSTMQDVTSTATWGSTNGTVASISATGLATALTVGTTTISATASSVPGSTTLTVTPAVVDSIVLSGRTFTAVGASTRLTATGTLSDATMADVTALATWSSDAPAFARAATLVGVRGVVNGLGAGTANISATVGTANASVAVRVRDVNAPFTGRCSSGLVISQLYGGGGNASAPFRNDFLEIHNAGVTARSLNGMSLQYTSDTGTAWAGNLRPLPNVTIEPGGYFLIQLNTNGTVGAQIAADYVLPTQLNISATAGKIALVSNAVGMPVNVCPDGTVTVDFIGFGATANCSETTPTAPPSNTTALFRGVSGCRDENANASDFSVAAPNPRGATATAPVLCSCAVNETDLSEEEQYCNLQFPSVMSRAAGALSDTVFSRVFHAGLTEPMGADPSIIVEAGFGPSAANPLSTATWSWWPASFNVQSGNDDEYQSAFIVPAAATYDFTARTSRDGVNWTYCDANGAGSNAGLSFEPTQLGALTSTP